MKRYLIVTIILAMLMAWGCDENTKQQQQTEANPEKITEQPDPSAELLEQGRAISLKMQKLLGTNLKAALDSAGVPHALTFCNLNAIKLTDSLSTEMGVKVSRVSHRPRNMNNLANSYEMDLIETYKANIVAGQVAEHQLHEEDGQQVYYAPIIITTPLCLKCHGEPGKDITAPDLIVLSMLYPEDKATDFKLGDLRGLWKVRFPKDDVAL